MSDNQETVDTASPKPSFRARLSILLIGGAALAGIVLMCVLVLVLAIRS